VLYSNWLVEFSSAVNGPSEFSRIFTFTKLIDSVREYVANDEIKI